MSPAILVGLSLLGASLLGFVLMLREKTARWAAYLVLTVGVFLYCFLVPKNGQGFEDIGYVIVAFLIAMPATFGLLAGGLMGWLRARRLRKDTT